MFSCKLACILHFYHTVFFSYFFKLISIQAIAEAQKPDSVASCDKIKAAYKTNIQKTQIYIMILKKKKIDQSHCGWSVSTLMSALHIVSDHFFYNPLKTTNWIHGFIYWF